MSFCTQCGAQRTGGDAFCRHCGYRNARPTIRFDGFDGARAPTVNDIPPVDTEPVPPSFAPPEPAQTPALQGPPPPPAPPPSNPSGSPDLRTSVIIEPEPPIPLGRVDELSQMCPYCLNSSASAAKVCPGCGSRYHDACWAAFGGCVHRSCGEWRLRPLLENA